MYQTAQVYPLRHAYVDTLGIIFSRRLDPEEKIRLQQCCKSVQRIWRRGFRAKGFYYVFQVVSHRACRILNELEMKWTRIVRLDVAVDLIHKTKKAAQEITRRVQRGLTLKSRRIKPCMFETTKYSNPRKSILNQVIYLEDRDRHGGRPCTHIEWRLRGSDIIQRNGIHHCRDVLFMDFKKFVEKHSRMEKIDYDALKKYVESPRHFVSNSTRRIGCSSTEVVRIACRHKWKGTVATRIERDVFKADDSIVTEPINRVLMVRKQQQRWW